MTSENGEEEKLKGSLCERSFRQIGDQMDFGTLSDPTTHLDDDDDFSEINDSIDTVNFQEKMNEKNPARGRQAGRQSGKQEKLD